MLFFNANVFTADDSSGEVDAFLVQNGGFIAVGRLAEVQKKAQELNCEDYETVDLENRFVMPGFIDSHTHLSMFGEALNKVQLRDCTTLEEIQQRLQQARDANPEAKRLLGVGWLFDSVGEEHPTKNQIDEVVSDIPVYLDANDLHSTWVNQAALDELAITQDTPDPIGGQIARDSSGDATGMFYETAVTHYVWPFLQLAKTEEELINNLEAAFRGYLNDGVTTVTDMALEETSVAALRKMLARDGRLPFAVTGHVLIQTTGDPGKDVQLVQEVTKLRAELLESGESEWLNIAGIKMIMDGVIDACTAAMRDPYANGDNASPIWSYAAASPVVAAADAAGLQVAMHAIGDRASKIALGAIERAICLNGHKPRRHRIEHLESVTEDTISRMANLEVIASMQPVHCDPAVLENWKAVLGDERAETGFPWHLLRKHGVEYTLGSDAPTAPHHPIPNFYIAITAASVLNPSFEPYHPERVFGPKDALVAFTKGGAYAGNFENLSGSIASGLQANFAVLDTDLLRAPADEILRAKVLETYVLGERAYKAN